MSGIVCPKWKSALLCAEPQGRHQAPDCPGAGGQDGQSPLGPVRQQPPPPPREAPQPPTQALLRLPCHLPATCPTRQHSGCSGSSGPWQWWVFPAWTPDGSSNLRLSELSPHQSHAGREGRAGRPQRVLLGKTGSRAKVTAARDSPPPGDRPSPLRPHPQPRAGATNPVAEDKPLPSIIPEVRSLESGARPTSCWFQLPEPLPLLGSRPLFHLQSGQLKVWPQLTCPLTWTLVTPLGTQDRLISGSFPEYHLHRAGDSTHHPAIHHAFTLASPGWIRLTREETKRHGGLWGPLSAAA